MNTLLSYKCVKRLLPYLALLIFNFGYTQCPQSITFPASANATTTINTNGYRIGNSVLTISNTSTVSFTNTLEASHQSAVGVEIGHSGNADTFANRVETQLTFSQSVYNLNFNINDLDAGDHIRILAYDQNNNLINFGTGNFTLYNTPSTTQITYTASPNKEFSSGSANIASSDTNLAARIGVNFNGLYVSRIVFQYYDTNGNGSYTIAAISGQALCANPDSFSGTKGNFTTSTAISNDFHLATPATSSNVTASAVGTWPSGISINPNGTISVTNAALAGVYNLNYRICSSTIPGDCAASVITLTVLEDSDGDGVADYADLDDDNDGILDNDEGYCSSNSVYTLNFSNTLASAASTFNANGSTFNLVYTLTSGTAVAGLGNSFTIPVTYSDLNNSVNTVNHIWDQPAIINISGTNSLRMLPDVASFINPRTNLPSNNRQEENWSSVGSPNTADNRFRYLLSSGRIDRLGTFTTQIGNIPTVNNLLSSYSSHTPFEWNSSLGASSGQTAGSYKQGFYSKLQMQNTPNPVDQTVTLLYSVNYGSTYTWDYTAFRDDNDSGGILTNSGDRGFFNIYQNQIVFCNHTDTDGDGIPNYLDLDSDNDGCPDAIEGSSTTITSSNLVNSSMSGGNSGATSGTYNLPVTQNLGNNVNTTPNSTSYGVPVIAGSGQAIGTSQTANTVITTITAGSNQTINPGTAPTTLSLTGITTGVGIQWQVSTDNVTFNNISSATGSSYSPGALTATTYYRANLTSAGGCAATTNVVTITVNSVCYNDPTLVSGQSYPVKHGITTLGRAGSNNGNWPMLRNSAYTALESKTKGFVVTRNSSPETTITIPVVGMMVFDTDENAGAGCLKIYTGPGTNEGWKCFSTQGCP